MSRKNKPISANYVKMRGFHISMRSVGETSRSRCNRAARPPGQRRQKAPFIVGRGPVPRQRSRNPTIAGETRSDARMASEGPRATIKNGS